VYVQKALCHSRLFSKIHYSYVKSLDHLYFHSLFTRRRHFGECFVVNVHNDFKWCPSLLETVGISVPIRNFRDVSLFTAGSSYESCPASWCASHENNIFKDTYVFINQQVTFTLVIF
jgi:hypothetical protein